MNATNTLRPRASSPMSVEGPSANTSPAFTHDWPLIDARVLIGALILDQIVNVDACVASFAALAFGTHHNPLGVDALDHTVTTGNRGDTRIAAHGFLQAGTDQRRFGLK